VLSYHSDIVKQRLLLKLYTPLMHRFLASVDQIVTASPNYLQSSTVLQQYKDKTKVITYGLDKQSYPPVTQERCDFWHQRFPQGFFLFVGVMRYYKGLHILLDACANCDLPVVIVGAGPMEAALRAQAARMQLRKVHFLGALPDADKSTLLSLCHAVVFPSHLRSEAFGISLLEGAMFGKPMISSEIGTGTTYINIDGETGIVVPPEDPEALRKAMHRLWNDPALASEMGKAAARRYAELFTQDRMGLAMVDLYRNLAKKQSRVL